MSILERAQQQRQSRQQEQARQFVPVEDGLAQSAYQEATRPRYVGQPTGGNLPSRVYSADQFREMARQEALRKQQMNQQQQYDVQEAMRPQGVVR